MQEDKNTNQINFINPRSDKLTTIPISGFLPPEIFMANIMTLGLIDEFKKFLEDNLPKE